MNVKSVIIVLAAVIAGTLGGAVTYQMAVPAGNAEPATTESIVLKSPGDKARREKPKVKFAPCKPPAKLEGRRCVTDVVRTVTVPGQPAAPVAPVAAQSAPRAASAPAAPAPAPASASGSSWNDDRRGGDDSDDDDSGYDDDDDNSGPGGGDDDTHTGTHTQTRSQTGGTHTRTRSHD